MSNLVRHRFVVFMLSTVEEQRNSDLSWRCCLPICLARKCYAFKFPINVDRSTVNHVLQMCFRMLKLIATSGFLTALECTKFVFGHGSAPNPAGRAHDASPDSVVGWWGDTLSPSLTPFGAYTTRFWRRLDFSGYCFPQHFTPEPRLGKTVISFDNACNTSALWR